MIAVLIAFFVGLWFGNSKHTFFLTVEKEFNNFVQLIKTKIK